LFRRAAHKQLEAQVPNRTRHRPEPPARPDPPERATPRTTTSARPEDQPRPQADPQERARRGRPTPRDPTTPHARRQRQRTHGRHGNERSSEHETPPREKQHRPDQTAAGRSLAPRRARRPSIPANSSPRLSWLRCGDATNLPGRRPTARCGDAANSQYEPSRGEHGCGRARASGGGLGAINVVTAILSMGSGALHVGVYWEDTAAII
jgi:hypothetical protein